MELEFNFKLSPLYSLMKRRLCFDIEANGLLKEVSLFFCAVTHDVDSDEVRYYEPQDIQEFLKALDTASWLIGHNIIGYDLPALHKLHGWTPNKDTVLCDTLIMSRMYNPNLTLHPDCPRKVWNAHNESWKTVGPHTLMNLGYIVGEIKGDFGTEKAFDEYCPEMLEYCAQDVKVNVAIFRWLEKIMKAWSPESIMCEMEVATYITRQIRGGWFFDIEGADTLRNTIQAEIERLEALVREKFGPVYKPKATEKDEFDVIIPRVTQPRVKKDGKLSSVGLKSIFGETYDFIIPVPEHTIFADRVEYYSGAFTPVVTEEFNLGSRQQIAERMQRIGWKPTKYTDKGNIIIDDDSLDDMKASGIPEGALLQEYFLASKRLSMVQGWIDAYDWDTGCIHGYVNSVGAVTSRMTHSSPNVAQVPAARCTDVQGLIYEGGKVEYSGKVKDTALCLMTYSGKRYKKGDLVVVDTSDGVPVSLQHEAKFLKSSEWTLDQFKVAAAHGEILLWGKPGNWGADCRNLFTVKEGRKLVGCDASGLELRCLAHYMNDEEYTDLILHGDIHTHNQHLAGLPARRDAKTFIYAFLYGAGDGKIGSIVGGGSKEGKKLKAQFLKGLPKLKKLLDNIASTVESRGMRGTASLKGIDKRIVRVRSPHAALNSLLQSCGALVMKYWLICVVREADRLGLDYAPVGNIHKTLWLPRGI